MNVENLLREEVTSELQELKKMGLGTDKYKMTVDGATKLMDRVIELEKIQMEHDEKVASREAENEIKQAQLKAEKRNNLVKNGIALGTAIASIGLTLWGTKTCLEYDEKGVIPTTSIGKQFISKLLPKK